MIEAWRPSASFETLKARAGLLARIRTFFAERGVWEVSTPILSTGSITDPNINSLRTRVKGGTVPKDCYLQTSPEFAMKRLLAAGSGAIYQICPVFRDGEIGSRHNPEFTMLEWYRPNFDHHSLMDEMDDLLRHCLPEPLSAAKPTRISYRDAFLRSLNFDPFTATVQLCQVCCAANNIDYPVSMITQTDGDAASLDTWLDLILSHRVATTFAKDRATFLYDYPASQAALAKIRNENGYRVASRFEVFWGELELANGFHELTDAQEQQRRFENENDSRLRQQQQAVVIDQFFLQALQSGMPECSGVALGIDRVLMVLLRRSQINRVLAFPFDIA